MAVRLSHPNLLGLPVHGDQVGGHVRTESCRHRCATQKGAGPPASGEVSGDQQLAIGVQLAAGSQHPVDDL